jgi:hypothetical protein
MRAAFRRLLAWLDASPPAPHRDLAIAVAANEEPATTVLVILARYLPHGGSDEIVARLREDGGRLERIRTPERSLALRFIRELTSDESRRLAEELERSHAWNLPDQHGPVIDGLSCGVALAKGDRLHHCWLRGGDPSLRSSDASLPVHQKLLALLCGLAPVHETSRDEH